MERILRYFSQNTLLVNLIVIFIIFVGVMSNFNIKREIYPAVDIDTMLIFVVYPGASSSDVEMNSVVPIEKELRKISGIKEFTSFSIENGATIYVYLDFDLANKQAVKDEIFRKVTKGNIPEIPEEVDKIKIYDINPKLLPVLKIGVFPKEGATVDEKDLYDFSESLANRILKIRGVSDVGKNGWREEEIHINVHPDKMDKYYVSLNDVVRSIKARNIRATGGTLQSLQKEKTIVAIGQFENPLDVKDVIIRSSFEEKRVRIDDIADVKRSFKNQEVMVKVNRKKAVNLIVSKKENADTVEAAENVKEFLDENRDTFDSRFEVSIIEDKSVSITSPLNAVLQNAAIGFVLVILVLFLFLDLRTSFWTAFSIPVSLLVTLTYMNLTDMTINLLSIAAIITILGMLVDDGIVVSEIIYEKRESGFRPIEAAVSGVQAVIAPVTVSIITTIVAFLPMLAIKGMMGKVIFVFPVMVTVTLVASLLEAFFILPNHLVHSGQMITDADKRSRAVGAQAKRNWFEPIAVRYEDFLKRILKFRYFIVLFFIFIFFATIFISRETIEGFVLFWDDSSDTIYVNLEAPDGTSMKHTEALTARVEEIVLCKIPEKERVSIQTNIGHHRVQPIKSKGKHENWSQVVVVLVPRNERERTAAELITDLRKEINIEKLPQFTSILFEEKSIGPPAGEPVNIKIINRDFEIASRIHQDIEAYLSNLPGVMDIDNDQKAGKEELKIIFDYDKLAQYGLNVAAVAQTIRTAYEGTVATSIETLDARLDFRVKVDDSYQRDKVFLENLLIPNYYGRLVKLKNVASIVIQRGRSIINHYNGDRVITITANVDEDVITPSQVARKISERYNDIPRKYPGTAIEFGGEAKETKESLSDLGVAFIIAVLMVYFILILLYSSISQPMLILINVPFGIIGALLAFTIHGIPLTFMGVIGIIGLSGVVVNDSVVMIDFINKLFKEEEGSDRAQPTDIIARGARQRLRPVILTTLTTVFGLMPTVYGVGGISNAIVPTVMAMAYGLLFATFLTLIFIPSLYMVNMDMKSLFSR
jgi:multidrug efflux pump subunit AcrB